MTKHITRVQLERYPEPEYQGYRVPYNLLGLRSTCVRPCSHAYNLGVDGGTGYQSWTGTLETDYIHWNYTGSRGSEQALHVEVMDLFSHTTLGSWVCLGVLVEVILFQMVDMVYPKFVEYARSSKIWRNNKHCPLPPNSRA